VKLRSFLVAELHSGKTVTFRKPGQNAEPTLGHRHPYGNDGERLIITSYRLSDLRHITDEEARAEGAKDRGDYFRWWYEEVDGVKPPASTGEPWFATPVWVITAVRDAGHRVRNLTKDSTHGYTESLIGVLEVGEGVEDSYLKRFEQDAQLIAGQQQEIYEAAWNAQSLARRVALLEANPATSEHQLASLRKRVEQLEKRAQRKAA
jgi:hypothetical protein